MLLEVTESDITDRCGLDIGDTRPFNIFEVELNVDPPLDNLLKPNSSATPPRNLRFAKT